MECGADTFVLHQKTLNICRDGCFVEDSRCPPLEQIRRIECCHSDTNSLDPWMGLLHDFYSRLRRTLERRHTAGKFFPNCFRFVYHMRVRGRTTAQPSAQQRESDVHLAGLTRRRTCMTTYANVEVPKSSSG